LDICFAALFYRILASNAFFSLKKMTRYLQATPTYFLEPENGSAKEVAFNGEMSGES